MVNNTNSSVSPTQLIIFLFIFIIFVIIGITIDDRNQKISYFLVVSLILFTLFNGYLTIIYYKDLRNVGGKQGERGLPGEEGLRGDTGVCTFSKKCGITNCEEEVNKESKEYYKDIINNIGNDCYNDPKNCENDEKTNISKDIKKLNDVRIDKCKKSKQKWNELKTQLYPPINP